MQRKNMTGNILFSIFAATILFPFSLRDPYFVSDAGNYIAHASFDIDFSQPGYYSSPLYWFMVELIGPIFQDGFVIVLSLIVSSLIIISSMKLTGTDRYIYLLLCIVSPIIFTLLQLSLRNGLAIGFILLALASRRRIFLVLAPLLHPGVLPMVLLLAALRRFSQGWHWILSIALLIITIPIVTPIIDTLLQIRGYSEQGGTSLAGWYTYSTFFLISLLYFLALKGDSRRLFLPIMFFIWIAIGFNYEFGGRLFLQSIPISLFLIFKSPTVKLYKQLFVVTFSFFSLYGLAVWHPISAYWEGWPSYWLTLIG